MFGDCCDLRVLLPLRPGFDETSGEDRPDYRIYRNEENTQEVFLCLLALPLLPVEDIDLAFKDVTGMVTEDSLSKTQLEQLCRYVKEWLTKKQHWARRGCRYETILRFRTTLRQRISHPNLFAFLGYLERTTEDSQADSTAA